MIKVPSLILQPFIENAIWHGLSSKKGAKKLTLSFDNLDNHFLQVTIEDNGIGREKSAEIKKKKLYKKESVGIQLTTERLRNFSKNFQHDYAITFKDVFDEQGMASGTRVLVKIPIL